MRKLRVLNMILKHTKTYPLIWGFVVFLLLDAFFIQMVEPDIHSYGDALWYCYAVVSTAGFGDVVVTTFYGKIASVLLTIYALFVFALATGVVVNFHGQIIQLRQKDSLAAVVDKLEHLPELSKEELEDISRKVKHFAEERE